MKSVNKVILIGNLGKDPEVKHTPQGTAGCEDHSGYQRALQGKDGQLAGPHRMAQRGALAAAGEIAGEYLKKGGKVYIEGRLQTRSWDDKQTGQKKYMTEVVAKRSRPAWRTRRGWWRWRLRRPVRADRRPRPRRAATTSTRARRSRSTCRRAVLRSRMRIFRSKERIGAHRRLQAEPAFPAAAVCLRLKGKTRRRSSSTGGAGALEYRRTASHRAQLQVSRFQVGSCVRESSGRAGRGAGASSRHPAGMGQGRNHSLDPRCGWLDRVGFYSGSEDRPTKLASCIQLYLLPLVLNSQVLPIPFAIAIVICILTS